MLSPNALRVLDSVGAYERLKTRALQLDVLSFTDGKNEVTDKYYFGNEEMYGYPALRVVRKDVLDVMIGMLQEKGVPVHFEKKLIGVTDAGGEEVELEFANGEKVSAPLVIGADGIHSTVRQSFLPDVKAVFAGFLGINCHVDRSKLRVPEGYPLPATVMGKNGAFLLVPQNADGSELFIGSQRMFPDLGTEGWAALRKDKQKLYDMLQENKSSWPDIVQSALEAAEVDRMNFWAFHGIPPLKSWLSDSKRIILVGDAAHAIPPTVAQGANQAFEDVRSLATLLARLSERVPLDRAAEKWQAYRKDRVDRVLELTKQMNAKRMPEAVRAKMPPGAVWSDQSLTRGDGGELKWLYGPDLVQEAEKWVQELESEHVGVSK
jgi:2-polyprenyl-6-methoxyphenol hydroxylase-like FAD-dependent oxidoreductase